MASLRTVAQEGPDEGARLMIWEGGGRDGDSINILEEGPPKAILGDDCSDDPLRVKPTFQLFILFLLEREFH